MENKETSQNQNMLSRLFQREELSEYINDVIEIPCSILEGGLKEINEKFVICECDPERCNPICLECFKKCHFNGLKYPHKEIETKEMNAVCICGFKCHQPLNEQEKHDKLYKLSCTFGELATIQGLNFSYQDVESSNANICLVCYNICYEAPKNLIKHSHGDLKGFKCSCKNHNHSDIKIIFRKLRLLAKKNYFFKKYNFEGMTFIHFLNILFKTKISFRNLFHSFVLQIQKTNKNLENNEYFFEDHNILNDLHLTSQVLLVFSQKCKNEYKIKNRILKGKEEENDNDEKLHEESESELLDKESEENKKSLSNKSIGVIGGHLDFIKVQVRPLCYFNEVVNEILDEKIYFKIMQRKFDYKSRNIWQLKYYLTSIFHKFYICKDFMEYPILKVYDLLLLSPLQRVLIVSSIEYEHKMNKYVNNLNFNYLNNLLKSIEAIINSQEKPISSYLILRKLYKICLFFAKYSLFNHEQLITLCSLNNTLLCLFDEDKPNREVDFLKLKVVSPMIKVLVVLAYYFNDQLIVSALKGEKIFDQMHFYHGKTEINKNITANVVLILMFLHRFEENVIIEQQNIEKKKIKKKEENEMNNKFQENIPPKQHYIKCLKNVFRNIQLMLNISLFPDEEYNSGISRLIDNDQNILFQYIKGNFSPNEKEFLQKIRYYTEKIEENYFIYFNNISSQQNEEKFTQKYEDIITEFIRFFVPLYYLDKNKKEEIEEEDNSSLKNDNESEYSDKIEKDDKKDSREAANNNNKYLVLKSYFMQSFIKYIHCMFLNHISKKLPQEKFMIKPQIFKKIMEICYNFIYNCPENSFFILQSDFTNNFELLNDEQLFQALSIVNISLENISKSKRDLTNGRNLLHFLKVAILKSSKNEIIGEILKTLRTLSTSVNCFDLPSINKKIMNLCKIIFNYHKIIKNYFTLMTSARKEDRIMGAKKDIEKIVKKFMAVLNSLMNHKTLEDERDFLSTILSREQIASLLYTKTINISLRAELLDFYRKFFLEISLDRKDINYYISILINDFQIDKKDEIIDNPKYYKFLEILIKSSENFGEIVLEKEANFIKFELLNFQEVLTITTDKNKVRKYIESIVKNVFVYFTKFSCLSFDLNGFNCLSLYEIIYYFLKLKKYIYSQKEIFNPPNNDKIKVLFKRKYLTKFPPKFSLIHPEDSNNEGQQNRERKDFAKRFLVKEKKKIKVPKNDLEAVEYDMSMLEDENYDFLNFTKLRQIFIKHTEDFVQFQESKYMKDIFEKSYEVSEEKIDKYKKYLKSVGRLNNKYYNDIIEIISHYMNSKNDIENGSFIKQLSETNAHYNITYRLLICKSIPFFMTNCGGRFRDYIRWTLFRLLQNDTTEIQQEFINMEEENKDLEPIFNFNHLIDDFTANIMTIILRQINHNGFENRKEYIEACLNIKVMKFFCEEHNAHFQSFFFNNIFSSSKDVIVRYKARLKIKGKNHKINESINLIPSGQQKRKQPLKHSFSLSMLESKNEFHNNYSKRASVFEYLLRVLGKILLLSNWMNNRSEELDIYYYDIYFIILEFLIETVQGTTRENLNKIFSGDKKNKRFFERFLIDINPMLIDDSSNSPLNYIIRKDMMDFIMAFLEESATPPNGIVEISSVLLPATILESIIATMNKLYEDKNEEEEDKDDDDKNNDKKKCSKKSQKDEKLKDKEEPVYIKRNFIFNPEMKKYFGNLYFNSTDFGEDGKFALANRMYQYFKMLGQSSAYKNSYVSEFYFKLDMFSLEQVTKAYYNKTYKLINKVTNAAITDSKFNDQYLCVSFFESITRTVYVQKEGQDEQVSIIFTINPMVPLLSKISKDDFIDNVDRSDRYTKLVSLLERCDNFYAEIKYRQTSGNSNFILKFINDINFYFLEVLGFVLTLIANIFMLSTFNGEGDVLYGDPTVNMIVKYLGYSNLILNIANLILWLIAKYKLLYMTECQKMIKNYEEQNNEEDKIISLTLSDKFMAGFNVLIRKNKLLPFIWNIILSFFAAYKGVYIIYILQLFIILNLSSTLRNLVSAVALRGGQLISVFYFSVIVNLCLSSVAFFYFEEDFIKEIDSKMPHEYPSSFSFLNDLIGGVYTEPSHEESECGTFAYCLMTHLDYGMRFDGGIADRMSKRSYNYNPSMYISRFIYEMLYFWSQTVMLQGMLFSIVIEAFSELRNKELEIEKDKNEICFICGIDKASCEKNGQKFEEHTTKEHNLWTYVDYILGLRFVDIQDTNAINSYVMEKILRKELVWMPMYIKKEDGKGDD